MDTDATGSHFKLPLTPESGFLKCAELDFSRPKPDRAKAHEAPDLSEGTGRGKPTHSRQSKQVWPKEDSRGRGRGIAQVQGCKVGSGRLPGSLAWQLGRYELSLALGVYTVSLSVF